MDYFQEGVICGFAAAAVVLFKSMGIDASSFPDQGCWIDVWHRSASNYEALYVAEFPGFFSGNLADSLNADIKILPEPGS